MITETTTITRTLALVFELKILEVVSLTKINGLPGKLWPASIAGKLLGYLIYS